MKLQIAIYAVAAKKELEYQPEKELVRYLGAKPNNKEKAELEVPLDRVGHQKYRRVGHQYSAQGISNRRFKDSRR